MNRDPTIRRRRVVQWIAGGIAGGIAGATGMIQSPARALATVPDSPVSDGILTFTFDGTLRSRLTARSNGRRCLLTGFGATETLRLADGRALERFRVHEYASESLDDVHGRGTLHTVTGTSAEGIEKKLLIAFYESYPGTALLKVRYRNLTARAVTVSSWTNAAHVIPKHEANHGFWSFSGASYDDRRDWLQPVTDGFDQRNYLGMNASDYGGGTPVVDVWRPDVGLAVGHVETHPELVALPIKAVPGGVRIAVEANQPVTLPAGAGFDTYQCFVHVHQGDHFASLDTYRRLMGELGLRAPRAPEAAYGPIWCAWGYERNFTLAEIEGTLQKAKSLGFEWAVMDDGWQTAEGDWYLDRRKFPRGEADMAAYTTAVKNAGMKARLWLAPLAVSPGSDLLHDHVDLLLLDKNGAAQNVSWWNAFYLCPAYQPTVEYHKALVTKIIGQWGFAGLKLDGQHLNGVAPCYNPAHHHTRPEESIEKLQDFWRALYETAMSINPDALVELCPCGTSFAFHNMPYMNQTPASDPESSWQVRLKGKSLKALMGSAASFAGDHVELSDHGDDFASTIGIGAVVSTKFTWPADTPHPTAPRPAGGYLLTPEKERRWQEWVTIYKDKMLPKGRYLGALYDIGFDKPEAHAIEKQGRLYYAFYAEGWNGPVELRGLAAGHYAVTNYVDRKALGRVSAQANRLHVAFERFLLLEAVPVGGDGAPV